MTRRLLSTFPLLWDRHKQLYSEVFSDALLELTKIDIISGDEDAISELLCIALNNVCYKIGKARNQEIQTPIWEGPIQPVTISELKGGKIRKRPDFSCKCVNSFAKAPERHEISLHVECKRLGEPTSSSWILNKNYVKNGIERFDSSIHKYGERAETGMMIGYIVSMTPKKIETEINNYQNKYLPDNSNINFNFNSSLCFKTNQCLHRKNLKPTCFKIIHFWLDLRNCYQL